MRQCSSSRSAAITSPACARSVRRCGGGSGCFRSPTQSRLEWRIRTFDAELKAEWPGILGGLEWQSIGLSPPRVVVEATASYLDSEDVIGSWIEECCELDAQAWASSADLFTSWQEWATSREEWVGSTKQFSSRMEDHGYVKHKDRATDLHGFRGLRLKTKEQGPAQGELPMKAEGVSQGVWEPDVPPQGEEVVM